MTEQISLVVNGAQRDIGVEPRRLLVQLLREDLGLTGTHVGCDTSQCGACTVHLDGEAVKSCTVLAVQADGGASRPSRAWRTEASSTRSSRLLGEARPPVRLLHAGHDHGRGRPPGPRTRTPPSEEIRHAIEGNFCRCTGYQNIVAAIQAAGAARCGAASAAADGRPSAS